MVLREGLRSSFLLVSAALAVACSVGEGGGGFSSGPSLTFGGDASASAEDGPSEESGDPTEGTGNDSATSMASGVDSADSADGCTPGAELCNGIDDDCDGAIDNGNPEGGQVCETGLAGVCSAGTSVCENGAVACAADVGASAEVCDGLDNDCNGQNDDGNPGGGGACNTGMPGVCADGIASCGGGVMDCTPTTAPSAEACNGQDDDCDGAVDNGNPGGGGACGTGMPGICSAGTQQCLGGALSCQQNQAAAADEICGNGLDDDCNGAVEDGCNTCSHPICMTGIALVNGCDPCVTQICAVDPFCCNNSWDGICVGEVGSVCGIAC